MRIRAFAPCDPDALARLEATLRIELPRQYRSWLLQTNGGIVEDLRLPCFPVHDNPRSSEEIISVFLGIVPSQPRYDIEAAIRDHLWILRQDHIPIAWCEGSGLLSIQLTVWSDKIYFWDVCDEGEANGLRTPYFGAENIQDLIASLKEA